MASAQLQIGLWMAVYKRACGNEIDDEGDPDARLAYAQLCRHSTVPDLNGLLDTLQRRSSLTRQWRQFLSKYPVLLCPVSGELPFADLLDVQSEAAFDRVFEAQLTQIGLPLMGLPGPGLTPPRRRHWGRAPP